MGWWWKKKPYNPGGMGVMRSPFAIKKANVWKQRLSMAYVFVGFNAFIVVVYACTHGKADWAEYYGLKSDQERDERPGRAWTRLLGISRGATGTVYRVKGFEVVDKYEIDNETPNATIDKTL